MLPFKQILKNNLSENTQINIENIFNEFRSDITFFSRYLNEYKDAVFDNDIQTPEIIHVRETLDKNTQDKRILDILDNLNKCSIRIINDIIALSQFFESGYNYSNEKIAEYNLNLIDLVGECLNLNTRFKQLSKRSKSLEEVQFDLMSNLEKLNGSILIYNKKHPQSIDILGISEAYSKYAKNTPDFSRGLFLLP